MKKILLLIIALPTLLGAQEKVYLSDLYAEQGLNKNKVELWEDGYRTKGQKDTYEWWYFDFVADDGTTIVISILTKDIENPKTKLKPKIIIDITERDGDKHNLSFDIPRDDFYASRDSCFIAAGNSTITGDLKKYKIDINTEEVKIKMTLINQSVSWRPKTGYMIFDEDKYFAWVVPVPRGKATGYFEINGYDYQFDGHGYHDHNWGNYRLPSLLHHWYWSRTQFGNYTVLASEIVTEKQYDYKTFTLFAVFDSNKVVLYSDQDSSEFYQSVPVKYPPGKPISKNLLFRSNDGQKIYELSLKTEDILVSADLVKSNIKNPAAATAIKVITGFDGAYYRFGGKASLEIFDKNGKYRKLKTDNAVWELMYFGD